MNSQMYHAKKNYWKFQNRFYWSTFIYVFLTSPTYMLLRATTWHNWAGLVSKDRQEKKTIVFKLGKWLVIALCKGKSN